MDVLSTQPLHAPLYDGMHQVPLGKIASVVTYLRHTTRPDPVPRPALGGAGRSLAPLGADLPRYRALFAAVGEPWLWFSRRRMADGTLRAILEHPDVAAFALVEDDRDGRPRDLGILELDWREPGRCEIAFLGVTPDAVGSGAGRFLMREALRRAWERPIGAVVVHTCTLDHPGALAFYLRSGFEPYARAVEVADDPRLTGEMGPAAGAGVPAIGPP
jgi:GNAT superfamily N-acetyltransferase